VTPVRPARVSWLVLGAGAFLLPVTYSWTTYDGFVLPKLLLGRVLAIGLLILLLARLMANRIFVLRRSALDLPLVVFVCSALASTILAANRNVALFGTYSRYDGVLTTFLYVALYWLAVQVISTPADARGLLRTLLASGYLVAAVAIVQSVAASVAAGSIMPAFGTLGQQNVLGAFLAMLLPPAFRELVEADSWSKRIIAMNLLAVLGGALLLTLSRSAWLGTLAAAVALLIAKRPSFRPGIDVISLLVVAVMVIGGLTTSGGRLIERQVQSRIMTIFDPNAWGPRPTIWRDTLGVIASRPLFGYGPDNFGLVYPEFQSRNLGRSQVDKAHAESLQIAATQGLLGLAAYAFLLAVFIRAFWRGRKNAGAVAIFAGWLGYQVTLQLNFSALASSLPFWIFSAAAMEVWGATWTARSLSPGNRRWLTVATPIGIAALVVLAIYSTVWPYRADAQLRTAVNADVGGRVADAGKASLQARDLWPSESVYAVEVGNIAFEQSDWNRAAHAYADAERLGTFNPLVYRNLALADRNLGRLREAAAAARKAVEFDRFDPANQALLAEFQAVAP